MSQSDPSPVAHAQLADPTPVEPRRRRWPLLLLALLLMVAGGSAYAAGSSLPTASARVVGGNLPVNAGAVDRRDISAHNSPTLVQNPTNPQNLVVVNRIDTPMFSCGLHVSFDGGARWQDGRLPFPEGEELPERCFAPDAAFDPDGTLHISFVTLIGRGNTPNALWLASSTDGASTFSTPTRVAGALTFGARLAADPDRSGRLYLSWLQGLEVGNLKFTNPDNPVVVSRSDDGGRSWSEPVRANAPAHVRAVAPQVAVGRGGQVVVLYLDMGEDVLDYHGAHEGQGGEPYDGRWTLAVARSSDQGATWTNSVVDDAVVPTERVIVFFPSTPTLVVDRGSRRVHVAFHDGRLGDSDAWVWTSTDGGATFGPPVRVNDTPLRDGRTQELPKVSVAPGGRLDVAYYDRRADPADVMTQVSLQSSDDGGHSFGGRLVLSDAPFDSGIGFGSERGMPDLGSRLGLVSTRTGAMAVWTDTRGGTEASNKQDLARGIVRFTPASAWRTPLRALGLLVAALGALTLVWGLRRSGPGRPLAREETAPLMRNHDITSADGAAQTTSGGAERPAEEAVER